MKNRTARNTEFPATATEIPKILEIPEIPETTAARSHLHLGASLKKSRTNKAARSHLHLGASSKRTTTKGKKSKVPSAPGRDNELHSRILPGAVDATSAPGRESRILPGAADATIAPGGVIDEATLALFAENQYSPTSIRRILFPVPMEATPMEDNTTDGQLVREITDNDDYDVLMALRSDRNWPLSRITDLVARASKEESQERRRQREEDEEASSSKRHNGASTPPVPKSPAKNTASAPQRKQPDWVDKSTNADKKKDKKEKKTTKTAKATKAVEKPVEKPVSTPAEKPTTKPPSIMANKIRPKEFSAALAAKGIKVNYKKAGNMTAIKCRNAEDHAAVMELLRTENPGGHSYTPKEKKKTMMLMKDVHYSIPIEDVKAAIKEQSGLVVEAKRLETTRSKNKGYVLDIVMVSVDEENVKELVKTRHVEQVIVKWVRMEKRDITQCHNCQQFGHIAANCLNPFVCVKCNEKHGPKECKRTTKDKFEDAFCYNCQKTGHPASFRGCPKALALKNKVDNGKIARVAAKEQQAHIEAAINNYVGEATFAQVTGRQPAQQRPQRPPHPRVQQQTPHRSELSAGFLGDECSRHFGMDLFTLMEKARTFTPRYRQLRTDSEQQIALLSFIFQLC